MPDFSKRDATPELMDTEPVSYEDFRTCLAQLAFINGLTFAYRPTLGFFRELKRKGLLPADRRILVLDAGSGYGDMGRKLDRWAETNGLQLEIIGVDMNPWSARSAGEATAPGRPLHWVTANLFDYDCGECPGIVISSIFTHHLPHESLVRFLRWMEENARIGWFINDLERHPVPYYALKSAFWATRRHRFIRHDGPVSVASAFKKRDWVQALKDAAIPEGAARIERWLPFRLCVKRIKDGA